MHKDLCGLFSGRSGMGRPLESSVREDVYEVSCEIYLHLLIPSRINVGLIRKA